MGKMFVFAGSWGMKPGPKGLSIFSYDPETAELEFVKRIHDEINVGNQCFDPKRKILYVTDEASHQRSHGVGGYVQAFSPDEAEGLAELGGCETLLPKPSYLWLDKSGSYLLAAHHSDRGRVTKLVRNADGSFSSRAVTDDAGLALLLLDSTGVPAEPVDYVLTVGKDPFGSHPLSHQHCVVADPTGELYLVCDKGQDCIYSFRLDREKGKLALIHTTQVEDGSAPRYAVFHPALPVVYENNEKRPVLNTYRYHVESGELILLDSIRLEEEGMEKLQASDLVLHPDGKHLYASVRGANTIVVFEIDEKGLLHRIQTVRCGGENPRGLCVSPDGRFLLCANIESNCITRFMTGEDGRLTAFGEPVQAHMPGNLLIASL